LKAFAQSQIRINLQMAYFVQMCTMVAGVADVVASGPSSARARPRATANAKNAGQCLQAKPNLPTSLQLAVQLLG